MRPSTGATPSWLGFRSSSTAASRLGVTPSSSCDAVLCSPAPVGSVPSLSLEPEFRRIHGSLYKALAEGD